MAMHEILHKDGKKRLHAKPDCNGRSFMNGCCLTCDSKRANAKNRREPSLLDHAMASLDRGFVGDAK